MGCRVGMSTHPYGRIDYWKRKEGHTGGEVLARNLTYEEAQDRENKEAAKRGCVSSEGGPRKGGRVWSVYHLWGGVVVR